MTYFSFHCILTLPLLVGLGLWARPWEWPGEKWAVVGAIVGVVYVFTTPWDNYAVSQGIWDFHRRKVWRRILHLPVEEYLFFLIQTLQVIFLTDALLREVPAGDSVAGLGWWTWLGGAGVLVGWLLVGRWGKPRFHRRSQGHYAWHLLFWFLPVIALQWVVGWGIFLPRMGYVLIPTLAIGFWLSYADLRAIQHGIWYFDPAQVSPRRLWGVLPWEEVAFFFLTSLLVAQSYLLLLPESLR